MAKIKLLVDTDIVIDFLKGMRAAKSLFNSEEIQIYCSVLSKKELLSKVGLSESERKRIIDILSSVRVLNIDNDISGKYSLLLEKYGDKPDMMADYVIAATAWSKKLPLLTRNKKHFSKIEEISLAPGYDEASVAKHQLRAWTPENQKNVRESLSDPRPSTVVETGKNVKKITKRWVDED